MQQFKNVSLISIAALIGCGDRPATIEPAVRDSAGIRIVENSEPTWTAPWSLSSDPVLSIGALEGKPAYEFTQIVSAVRLEDGRIIVADGLTKELRFFDSDGIFVQSVGGQGGGPGEFESLDAFSRLAGDSLFVYGNWRGSVFDKMGGFARSFGVEPPEMYLPMRPVGHFADGSFITVQYAYGVSGFAGPTRTERIDQSVYRYNSTGEGLDTFGPFTGREVVFIPASRGRSGFNRGWREFAKSTAFIAGGDRFVVADNDSFEIQIYQLDGRLESLIRKRHTPVPVTNEDIDALRAPRLANEERRAMMEQYFQDLPAPPETMPAFGSALRFDRQNNLWVIEYEKPGQTQQRRWTVFDPDGIWIGTLRLPDGFDLMDVGDDWILGRVRDEFDVEYMQLYALIKDR